MNQRTNGNGLNIGRALAGLVTAYAALNFAASDANAQATTPNQAAVQTLNNALGLTDVGSATVADFQFLLVGNPTITIGQINAFINFVQGGTTPGTSATIIVLTGVTTAPPQSTFVPGTSIVSVGGVNPTTGNGNTVTVTSTANSVSVMAFGASPTSLPPAPAGVTAKNGGRGGNAVVQVRTNQAGIAKGGDGANGQTAITPPIGSPPGTMPQPGGNGGDGGDGKAEPKGMKGNMMVMAIGGNGGHGGDGAGNTTGQPGGKGGKGGKATAKLDPAPHVTVAFAITQSGGKGGNGGHAFTTGGAGGIGGRVKVATAQALNAAAVAQGKGGNGGGGGNGLNPLSSFGGHGGDAGDGSTTVAASARKIGSTAQAVGGMGGTGGNGGSGVTMGGNGGDGGDGGNATAARALARSATPGAPGPGGAGGAVGGFNGTFGRPGVAKSLP